MSPLPRSEVPIGDLRGRPTGAAAGGLLWRPLGANEGSRGGEHIIVGVASIRVRSRFAGTQNKAPARADSAAMRLRTSKRRQQRRAIRNR